MGIGVIPIPTLVYSHSHFHSHVLVNSCPIPMELPWDSHSHWDSQFHAHLYNAPDPNKMYDFKRDILLDVLNVQIAT